jgi:hypothetical protein
VCWVCGKSGPYRYLLKNGWYVREIPLMSDKCREVYCPTCFAQWGWPDWKAHLATLGATA